MLCVLAGSVEAVAAGRLEVVVSVLPQQHFVERIGGDRVRVTPMVRPEQSPHTYEPTPRQVADISAADVYFRMGVGFEVSWMPRLRETSPEMRVVDLREGVALRAIEGYDHGRDDEHGHAAEAQKGSGEHEAAPGGDHDHGHQRGKAHDDAAAHGHADAYVGEREPVHDGDAGHAHKAEPGQGHAHPLDQPDPHVWTDPRNAITMAATIRDTLSELDPAGAEVYRERFAAFREALLELDAEIEAMLANVTHRRFMVYHPSWGYFADRYGLEQLAIELEGKEPGPATLAGVIEAAREAGVRVIFVQPQFSQRSARRVAEAIGGEVLAVDPLAEDYAANLRRVARAFCDAMQ